MIRAAPPRGFFPADRREGAQRPDHILYLAAAVRAAVILRFPAPAPPR